MVILSAVSLATWLATRPVAYDTAELFSDRLISGHGCTGMFFSTMDVKSDLIIFGSLYIAAAVGCWAILPTILVTSSLSYFWQSNANVFRAKGWFPYIKGLILTHTHAQTGFGDTLKSWNPLKKNQLQSLVQMKPAPTNKQRLYLGLSLVFGLCLQLPARCRPCSLPEQSYNISKKR